MYIVPKAKAVEYPELIGKRIKQVRFTTGDSQWTTLVMEFDDKTRASFHLTAEVHLALAPEISGTANNGDIDNWTVMETRPIMPHIGRVASGG